MASTQISRMFNSNNTHIQFVLAITYYLATNAGGLTAPVGAP
jgi:hypothetical protein